MCNQYNYTIRSSQQKSVKQLIREHLDSHNRHYHNSHHYAAVIVVRQQMNLRCGTVQLHVSHHIVRRVCLFVCLFKSFIVWCIVRLCCSHLLACVAVVGVCDVGQFSLCSYTYNSWNFAISSAVMATGLGHGTKHCQLPVPVRFHWETLIAVDVLLLNQSGVANEMQKLTHKSLPSCIETVIQLTRNWMPQCVSESGPTSRLVSTAVDVQLMMSQHWSVWAQAKPSSTHQSPSCATYARSFQVRVGTTLYTVHCTLYTVTVHCTYTVHCTLSFHCTCTLYTVHCTLYTVHCALVPGTRRDSTVHCTLLLDDWLSFRLAQNKSQRQ